ncbi:MAG: ethanolamine ammonia-lyase reactivating factor EutA, partial [Candidatus Limnocylindria bacterium]
GEPVGDIALLDPLPAGPRPTVVTFSGGVAEHLYGRDAAGHGDLGLELAAALRERVADLPGTLDRADEGIRATVIGASQFSVHLSGSTIFVSDERLLPLRDVPVVLAAASGAAAEVERGVRAAIERSGHGDGAVVVALPFHAEPRYATLRALAEGLARGVGARRPLVAALTGDVAHSVGRILASELGVIGGVVLIDDVRLEDLDYVDVGAVMRPAGFVPVVVKTLVLGPV